MNLRRMLGELFGGILSSLMVLVLPISGRMARLW